MKKRSPLSFFSLALGGIFRMIKKERNFRIHLIAATLVILLGFFVGLNQTEWLVLVLVIFSILAVETLNSGVEEVCNVLKEKLNLDYVETKWARDLAAGAVLLLAIASVILGLIIFLPYLL